MTQQEKMKAVVVAAGGCWHGIIRQTPMPMWTVFECACGKRNLYREDLDSHMNANPSPTDLNALFELADKLLCESIVKFRKYKTQRKLYCSIGDKIHTNGATRAEALLNALYEAIKKEEG